MQAEEVKQVEQVPEVQEVYDKIDQERDKNAEWDFFSINNKTSKFWPNECSAIDYTVKASTLNEYGSKGSELVFSVTTTGWLDPSSLHLSFNVYNGSTSHCQLDGSAHSLFSEFYVTVNGIKVESYKEYGRIHKFVSDLRMSRNERIERGNEGFGTNENGDNEYIFGPSGTNIYNKQGIENNGPDDEYISVLSETNQTSLGIPLKIKVESCIFGNKIDKKNWKIIPLDKLDIKFVYKLAPNFGFIPRFITFNASAEKDTILAEYSKDTNFTKTETKYPFDSILTTDKYIGKWKFTDGDQNDKLSNMKIIKPVLKFKKYIFSDEWNSKLLYDYSRIPMVFEMNSFDIIVTKWIDSNPSSLLMSIMLNKTEERVRAIYGAAYLINETDQQRIFARINPGFSKMQIQTDNTYWPYDAFFEKTEVYNVNSIKSIKPILYKLLRFNNISDVKFKSKVNKTLTDDFYVINKKNMARLVDLSFIPKDKITELERDINFGKIQSKQIGSCKWLNLISFDTVPYSNDSVIGGIRIQSGNALNILFKKSMEAITSSKFPEYYKNIKTYNMYLIMESNQILRMDIDGNTQII